MNVGDLVREVTRMNRTPITGVIIEIDYDNIPIASPTDHTNHDGEYLVEFYDGSCWMAKHHLELISEVR